MKEIELELINRLGLHARAASKLVQSASSFDSQVWLSHQDKRVNAKSIMGVLLLAAPCGSRLTLEVDGPDEDAAAEAIAGLVADRFGEGE
ncbi:MULTISPECIES: HPr family phosphocarrier protein [unclassified Wenzhouxiangella]|uniref:HPr family phosphocarrier protein n=1 Tax=unclassified Wenzhouxiangella TaxID=2613841 RepID=UPI000E328A17|nr:MULTISPECIES: HPr family phosphocarrier protein [unclassified Wenzhouxiangella]RFF28159.1 HPr family phosphocarrier protein [Wenzhouxiangella sp. 15181]RFP67974.1 HPr family phosphocarrier protein [Wenzhouxiangella sp. 15190]